ncbi:hypothetical protein [Rhodovulum sulfidophilum]|uniref:hypothetical protein n=1 Tax=Rhodovulum sulfidophilum TaxID=35806 RepID=UPI00117B7F9F|nr:hypothetical protein [Rhodovulum sulfidophilum]MBL3551519.1 hypothetical protein [Rhodovulum sulfidophilum]
MTDSTTDAFVPTLRSVIIDAFRRTGEPFWTGVANGLAVMTAAFILAVFGNAEEGVQHVESILSAFPLLLPILIPTVMIGIKWHNKFLD